MATTEQILVGVTGKGENTAALWFALAEARARRQGVTLVHSVNPHVPPPPPSALIADDTWLEVGAEVVADVRREAESLLDTLTVPITTLVESGSPSARLAELSKHASLVVLQHRDLSRVHRLVTGSTVASVAAHAHCPVVSVPADGHHANHGVVTVGVHQDGGPAQVVETAFALASARHASLRLIHAWHLPSAYKELRAEDARWSRENERMITAAIGELSDKYTEVPVTVEVLNDVPADVLADAAASSDLLVVGRHSGRVGPTRLGYLARAMVAHAQCPVFVVPL